MCRGHEYIWHSGLVHHDLVIDFYLVLCWLLRRCSGMHCTMISPFTLYTTEVLSLKTFEYCYAWYFS